MPDWPPPKEEETTIYQDLANKVKEDGKILGQGKHHRHVVRDAEAKLHKQQGLLQELVAHSQSLKQEIDTLQAQVTEGTAKSPCFFCCWCSGFSFQFPAKP